MLNESAASLNRFPCEDREMSSIINRITGRIPPHLERLKCSESGYIDGSVVDASFESGNMPGIDLQVPFSQKDEARRLGARWDGKRKTWYVPGGLDPRIFDQWLPKPQPPNIRAPFWYLATGTRVCWRCDAPSIIFAILLPPGYEALYVADDPADDCWEGGDNLTLLSYVDDVPQIVAAQLRLQAPRYRVDYSQTIHSFYWMNHCEHCEAKLGDFETLQEAGAFEGHVKLLEINEPFAASCASHTL